MADAGSQLENARRRILEVFGYLSALNQLRNPVKRLVQDQLWHKWLREIPDHPCVKNAAGHDSSTLDESQGEDFVLRIRRPKTTAPPPPPEPLQPWLAPGWEEVDGTIDLLSPEAATGDATSAPSLESPELARVLEDWREKRDEWAYSEKPAREAQKLFEQLYDLHGRLQREGEKVELVLGDGIVYWRREETPINHPVLLQRLSLEFDPQVPAFTLRETDDAVEFYAAPFLGLADVNAEGLARSREELENGDFGPLSDTSTSDFLQRFIVRLSARGQFVESGPKDHLGNLSDHPYVWRDPVLFLRSRSLGFTVALEAIRDDLQTRSELPGSLLRIVGVAPPSADFQEGENSLRLANEDSQVLFSKPANLEQLQIARRLSRFGSVLVQGPPGTGKAPAPLRERTRERYRES